MLKFYGTQPPSSIDNLRPGGVCPHCKEGVRFGRATHALPGPLKGDNIDEVVLSYFCEICLGPIPIQWHIIDWNGNTPRLSDPSIVIPSKDKFNFDHVPEDVQREIEEALNCLSVNAFNGFAALCRRVVQAICVELGANGSSKVQKQIKQMLQMTDLGDEWEALATQIMLTGHDGAHPHLPEVSFERAQVLLSLLRDLCYELFTRPGYIKASANLRKSAIEHNE